MVLISLTGCASHKEVTASEVFSSHSDVVTSRDTILHHDSIFFRDSVFVERLILGDTVFQTQYKERTVYRDRWHYATHNDTVLRTDTVHETVHSIPTSTRKYFYEGFLYGILACLVAIGLGLFVHHRYRS